MTWLSLPLPNPFKTQQPDEENLTEKEENFEEKEESSSHGGGVKEDLSELGRTIGRQLWGVASFLAPPPTTHSDSGKSSNSSSQTLLGIRNDFVEIGGSFKSGLSLLSTNKAVNEISRLASNILQLEREGGGGEDGDGSSGEDHGGIIGVTEEVLEFVREMSMRPEYWMDFPLSLNNDFDMSDAQREHTSIVESLAPSLAALRARLCPSQMSEGHFWMIYFILLHPRLNEHDSKLLSTLQIAEARDVLLQKLQKCSNKQVESCRSDDSFVDVSNKGSKIQEDNRLVREKEVLAETVNAARQVDVDKQEDIEQWLDEQDDETDTSVVAQKQLGNEDDVSFSDLEYDDDNDTSSRQHGLSSLMDAGVSSPNGSNEWVQLSKTSDTREGATKKAAQPTSREKDSEGEESNDWLTVDDFD